MSVGFAKPRNPDHLPEHVLWQLTKANRITEARSRMTPLGPELRVFVDDELLWSQVFRGVTAGVVLGKRSEEAMRELQGRGWVST